MKLAYRSAVMLMVIAPAAWAQEPSASNQTAADTAVGASEGRFPSVAAAAALPNRWLLLCWLHGCEERWPRQRK